MSGDIVERLRRWDDGGVSTHYDGCIDLHPVCAILWAARIIEARDAEIERLRAAGDALAKQASQPCRCVKAHDGAINETCAPCAAYFDWQEARREQ